MFCNPGSAVIQKRRRLRQVVVSRNGEVSARRRISFESGEPMIVDAVDNFSFFRQGAGDRLKHEAAQDGSVEVKEEYVEEELEFAQQHRQQHPPCLLFLDSLRCHRKKKFAAMLREYLDREWRNRHGSDNAEAVASGGVDDESIVAHFDADTITLLEPEVRANVVVFCRFDSDSGS